MDPAERADSPTSAAVPAPALTSEILAWHEITRRYRRPFGGWWWAALVLVPLVLALLSTTFGIGAQREANAAPAPSVSVSVPVASPSQPAAAGEKVPIALVRVGETITVTGTFAKEDGRRQAIQALQDALGPELTVSDQTGIAAGSSGLSAEAAAALGGAFLLVPDLSVQFDGKTVTLTGTAPSEQAVSAAEHAASIGYPGAGIRSELTAAGIDPYDAFSPEIMDIIAFHRVKIATQPSLAVAAE